MSDDDLVTVLGQSIVGAARVLHEGKPQAALDMIDIVMMGLPEQGLEVVELAALPTKIIALVQLGRFVDARLALSRLESLAAVHGSEDDLKACQLLRAQIAEPDLTSRANAATEAIIEGRVEGVAALEAIATEALDGQQYVVAIGVLALLGKVYATAKPALARERLLRAKQILDTEKPLDDQRHALAVGEIERLLDTLGN